jgi:hypothetical protein
MDSIQAIENKSHLTELIFGIIRNRPDGIRFLQTVLLNLLDLEKLKEKYRK